MLLFSKFKRYRILPRAGTFVIKAKNDEKSPYQANATLERILVMKKTQHVLDLFFSGVLMNVSNEYIIPSIPKLSPRF